MDISVGQMVMFYKEAYSGKAFYNKEMFKLQLVADRDYQWNNSLVL